MGQLTTYAIDENNRLQSRAYPDGSFASFTYYNNGERRTASDTHGTVQYSYDAQNRLSEVVQPATSSARKLTYGYFDNSRKKSLTADIALATLATLYDYDAAGRLRQVTDKNQAQYSVSYDAPTGNRSTVQYPNGVVTNYHFTDRHQLHSLASDDGAGAHLQSYTYTLALTGRRDAIAELDGITRGYGYDDLDRLKTETITNAAGLVYENDFDYYPNGNRHHETHKTAAPDVSTAYSYDTRDRLQSAGPVNYTFDADGNQKTQTGATAATYSWDYENRLVRAVTADGTVVQHTYDVDGNRVRTQTTPPTGPPSIVDYLVDASGGLSYVVAESVNGQWTAHYVRTPNESLAVLRPNEAKYVLADGLGSVRVLADGAGGVTDRYTYSAFGELLEHVGSDAQPYQFAGEPRDGATGLAYHRARWMDAGVGRFVSGDPFAEFQLSERLSPLFAYGENSLPSRVDPTGWVSNPVIGPSSGVIV